MLTLFATRHQQQVNSDKARQLFETSNLNQLLVNKAINAIDCANLANIEQKHMVTLIDYSIPSNQKRLWIFDLDNQKLLYHTYVSHGISSGELYTEYFSNKNNSKASSLGVYKTIGIYHGRHGRSLRLAGLDKGFNNNAEHRAIVMHGGWYVNEEFINKYGRAGRSWGCPAVPLEVSDQIIDTIKDNSLLVIYYPADIWFANSQFLNCHTMATNNVIRIPETVKPFAAINEAREDVLMTSIDKTANEILTIPARIYSAYFHKTAPLARMLRRQVNGEEYIALSTSEFYALLHGKTRLPPDMLAALQLLKAETEFSHGSNRIVFKPSHTGGALSIDAVAGRLLISLDQRPEVILYPTNRFIRWLGL